MFLNLKENLSKLSRDRGLRKMPLRTVLTVPFVLQICAAVGLVGYLSFRNSQNAVNDLADQLRGELTARIQQKLDSYFKIPHAINRLNATSFMHGEIEIDTAESVPLLLQQMKISPFLNAVYCGSNDGKFLGVSRSDADPEIFQLMVSNPSTDYRMHLYTLDVRGNRRFFIEEVAPYDPRIRPWYKVAIAAGQATWSPVYLDFTTQLPTVTASIPVYEQWGYRFLGVCGVDVLLSEELRQFLKNLEIGRSGQAFILDREGYILSSSSDELLTVQSGGKTQLLKAVNSTDPLIRSTARYIDDYQEKFQTIKIEKQVDLPIENRRHFVQISPFTDGQGLDWLIILVVPEADFMEQINANNRTAFLLCIAAAIVAIAVGILTSRWIAKPIRDLSQASAKMSDGQLTQTVKAKGVEELETLAQSFNRMAHQLHESFETLERKNADLRQTGDALAIAKEQLEAILNAVPGSISWIDAEGRYIGVNEHLAQMVNLPPEEIVGREVGFVDHSPEFATFIRQFLASSEPFFSRVISVRVGDRGRHYLMAARKYQQGNATVTVGIDITERKKAEEALQIAEENYRSIFENALEGIFQSSLDGHFISVNPAMAQIYGYDSSEEMLDSVTAIATQIYVYPEDQQEFQRRLREEGTVKNFEYQVYQKDGSIIWIEEDTRPVRDGQGNVLYYEGIIQDISQRKRQEEALKRQIQELKIEIDQQKREKDVAEITESDYFKELQMAAETLRFDENDW